MLNERSTSNKWLVFSLFQLVFSSSLCTSQHSSLIDHVFPRNTLGTYEVICKKTIVVRLKFYAEAVIFAQAFPLLIDFVHPPPSPFSFTTQC
jgi:hypothetical protein